MFGRDRSWPRALVLVGMASLAVLLLNGCESNATGGPGSIFRPAGRGADNIRELATILLIIAGTVFILYESVLAYTIIRYRRNPVSNVVQDHGSRKIEMTWTIATAVAIMFVLFLTVKTMVDIGNAPNQALPVSSAFPGDSMALRSIGHQWWWQFEYPQLGVVTANEIVIPVGRPVIVTNESADVVHSFWVPRLMGKTDMIPGKVNSSYLLAIEPGEYVGVCAEFCGPQHARMGFRVIAMLADGFSAWVSSQQQPASPPASELARAGEQRFQQNCAQCHSVRGSQARGQVGPDLTHLGSRTTIAANTEPNDPEHLTAWITDPQAVKPGNLMPKQNLDAVQISQLVAYLQGLK